MARPEVTAKKITTTETVIAKKKIMPPDDLDAFSIAEFCRRHSISVAMYYKLRAKKPPETPREMEVGTRVLITRESAADWRREGEAATEAKRRERERATEAETA
jgi:hypothetical protein